MAPSDREIAEFCLLGLRFAVLPLSAVHAWADEVIATRDEPPSWAIDLRTASVAEALSALNAALGSAANDLPVNLLVALVRRCWQKGELSLRDLKDIGFQLHLDGRLPQPSVGCDWGVVLSCEYEEFEQGYRSDDKMRASVEGKLAPYATYEHRLPGWV
jgi:hypothetical protein